MSDFITSLEQYIRARKSDQATALLAGLDKRPAHEKESVLEMLALAPDRICLDLLWFLTRPENPDEVFHDRLIQLTTDRAHLNFEFIFILLDHGDEQSVSQSIPLFRHVLNKETSTRILAKLIRTAGKKGIDALTPDIAEFIFYDDQALRSEAVTALERIGTPLALEKLTQASGTEKCDDDILDAVDVLQKKLNSAPGASKPESPGSEGADPDEIKALKALLSPRYEERFQAFSQAVREGQSRVTDLSAGLEQAGHDQALLTLRLIKMTFPEQALSQVLSLVGRKDLEKTIKFSAYSALESYPELKSAASVINGLSDTSSYVRIAAARVLDRHLSDYVAVEIKNRIESGTKKAETLARSILDAGAEQIIEQLMTSDTFSYMASNYLAREAPISVLDPFIRILEKRGLKSTARKYQEMKQARVQENRKELMLISNCRSILKTHQALAGSTGFEARCFTHPQKAFEALVERRPAAIICDLFLDDMTGIDIAREVRELYSTKQLPFIVSTLQQDLDRTDLGQAMESAGVTALCQFPAKVSQIRSWASKAHA